MSKQGEKTIFLFGQKHRNKKVFFSGCFFWGGRGRGGWKGSVRSTSASSFSSSIPAPPFPLPDPHFWVEEGRKAREKKLPAPPQA